MQGIARALNLSSANQVTDSMTMINASPRNRKFRQIVFLFGLVSVLFLFYLMYQRGSEIVVRYITKLEKFEQFVLQVKTDLDVVKTDLDVVKSNASFAMLSKCLTANCSHLSARVAMIDMQVSQAGTGGVVFWGTRLRKEPSFPKRFAAKGQSTLGLAEQPWGFL